MTGMHQNKKSSWKYFLIVVAIFIGMVVFTSCRYIPPLSEIVENKGNMQEHSSSVSEPNDDSSATSSSIDLETSERLSFESQIDELEEQMVDTPDVHSADWNLILVNRTHQLENDIDFEYYFTDNGRILDERIAEQYEAMMAEGRAQGLQFILVSSYRSLQQQQENYDSVYQSYIDRGYSPEESIKKTEEYIALPNASEHSTGLAVDITNPVLYTNSSQGLVEEFEETAEARWLYENAADYGFILRYPRGKEKITMIEYESWHFRYVGVENAHYIKEHQLTLEEYVEILQKNEKIQQSIEEIK